MSQHAIDLRPADARAICRWTLLLHRSSHAAYSTVIGDVKARVFVGDTSSLVSQASRAISARFGGLAQRIPPEFSPNSHGVCWRRPFPY
jgi:hypothetical protein